MSKVFVNIALSLDGYMAPKGMDMAHFSDQEYKNWGAKWGALMSWALNQQYLREKLKLGPGGETGPVNDMVRHTFERTGAHIMGKRVFDGGELGWPEEAPFHTPVYVLTHTVGEANPGYGRATQPSTLSTRVQNTRSRWLVRPLARVTSGSQVARTSSSSTCAWASSTSWRSLWFPCFSAAGDVYSRI